MDTPQTCTRRHVNLDLLHNVSPVPVSQLSPTCMHCGAPVTYASKVYFVTPKIDGQGDLQELFVEGYDGDRKMGGAEVQPVAEQLYAAIMAQRLAPAPLAN